MSTLPATLPGGSIRLLHPGRSSNLDAGLQSFGVAKIPGQALAGTRAGLILNSVPPLIRTGVPAPQFGGEWFEKILVFPRTKDVGFMLSDQVWPVEVWNSHRAQARDLTAINITGPGGLAVAGPTVLTFFPFQTQSYTATLYADGDATIQALATWAFTGELGADMLTTGSRITVFPHRPDWSEPYRERISWLTELFPGYDGSEQRRSLRQRPRYALTFRVLPTDPLETASLEALLYGWQAREFGVPMWPEASPLLADLAPGATSLSVDMTDRPTFEAGGLVMIWRDYATWEAFGVASLGSGSIALGSQVTKAWTAGARVVPLRRSHLSEDMTLGRPANWLSSGTFAFTCEAV